MTANSASPSGDELRFLRRDLRGLAALEAVQLALGIGGLLAIAVHAIVVTADRSLAVSLSLVALLALAYIALALRIRVGHAHLLREVEVLKARRDLDAAYRADATWQHPYRSPDFPVVRGEDELISPRAAHRTLLVHVALAALTIAAGTIAIRELFP
jgi:hypothetical protein